MSCPRISFNCLLKPPGARPNAATVLSRLESAEKALTSVSIPANSLQAVNAKLAAKNAQQSALESAQQTENDRRSELFTVSSTQLDSIIKAFQ